jgi:hypothetical protein
MTMLRSMRFVTLLGGLATLSLLIAAPAQATHPRPVGAAPMRMSLVPAYAPCAAPNRTHGPPLAFPSCNPPAQTSGQATVGTADANGGGANFLGSLKITVLVGTPGPPDDSNVYVRMDLRDVRCVPTGARCGTANLAGPADYSGEVGFEYGIRFTDHFNGVAPGGGTDAATMQDHTISSAIPCAGTASTNIGSTCSLYVGYNSITPGLIKDTKRVVEEIYDVHVYDGGADGVASTTGDNTVFLRQGIFIP